MKPFFSKALIALALAACPLAAQMGGPPPGIFPWWEGRVSADLNLSDAQRQQVEGIQREYRGKMIDGRAEMTKAELDLDDAMNADPFDQRKATDAANRAAKVRDEMTRNMSQMSIRLRAVLTKDQWAKVRTRSQRGFGGPRGGRPDFERGGGERGKGSGRAPRVGGPGGGSPGGAPPNQN